MWAINRTDNALSCLFLNTGYRDYCTQGFSWRRSSMIVTGEGRPLHLKEDTVRPGYSTVWRWCVLRTMDSLYWIHVRRLALSCWWYPPSPHHLFWMVGVWAVHAYTHTGNPPRGETLKHSPTTDLATLNKVSTYTL